MHHDFLHNIISKLKIFIQNKKFTCKIFDLKFRLSKIEKFRRKKKH